MFEMLIASWLFVRKLFRLSFDLNIFFLRTGCFLGKLLYGSLYLSLLIVFYHRSPLGQSDARMVAARNGRMCFVSCANAAVTP